MAQCINKFVNSKNVVQFFNALKYLSKINAAVIAIWCSNKYGGDGLHMAGRINNRDPILHLLGLLYRLGPLAVLRKRQVFSEKLDKLFDLVLLLCDDAKSVPALPLDL